MFIWSSHLLESRTHAVCQWYLTDSLSVTGTIKQVFLLERKYVWLINKFRIKTNLLDVNFFQSVCLALEIFKNVLIVQAVCSIPIWKDSTWEIVDNQVTPCLIRWSIFICKKQTIGTHIIYSNTKDKTIIKLYILIYKKHNSKTIVLLAYLVHTRTIGKFIFIWIWKRLVEEGIL